MSQCSTAPERGHDLFKGSVGIPRIQRIPHGKSPPFPAESHLRHDLADSPCCRNPHGPGMRGRPAWKLQLRPSFSHLPPPDLPLNLSALARGLMRKCAGFSWAWSSWFICLSKVSRHRPLVSTLQLSRFPCRGAVCNGSLLRLAIWWVTAHVDSRTVTLYWTSSISCWIKYTPRPPSR